MTAQTANKPWVDISMRDIDYIYPDGSKLIIIKAEANATDRNVLEQLVATIEERAKHYNLGIPNLNIILWITHSCYNEFRISDIWKLKNLIEQALIGSITIWGCCEDNKSPMLKATVMLTV